MNIDTQIKANGKTTKYHKSHRFAAKKRGRAAAKRAGKLVKAAKRAGKKARKAAAPAAGDDCDCEEEEDDCACEEKPRPFVMDMVQPATKARQPQRALPPPCCAPVAR